MGIIADILARLGLDNPTLIVGVRDDAAAAPADQTVSPVRLDANGYVKVNVAAGGGGGGDATAANQATQIAAEQAIETATESIDAKTPALGQALAGASVPVVLPMAQAGGALALDATLTGGTARVRVDGTAPITDATTGVYTRFPAVGTASTAFTAGIATVKNSAGRFRRAKVVYTGSTATVYVQLHAAADATAPSNATLVDVWPVGVDAPVLEIESAIDLACTNGVKFAMSSTAVTYTAAAAETGNIIVWGA